MIDTAMITYNELTSENKKACEDRAKTRQDGVYTFRGIAYRVRNGRITHFACNGEVLIPYGNFNVCAGNYQNYHTVAVKTLRGIS